jgi:hypothetical protein
VALASGEFAGGEGVAAGGAGDPVDVGCHLGGGESQDALAGADEVLMGFRRGGEAEDAALAEPLGGGHGGEVDGAVLVTVLINTTGVPK